MAARGQRLHARVTNPPSIISGQTGFGFVRFVPFILSGKWQQVPSKPHVFARNGEASSTGRADDYGRCDQHRLLRNRSNLGADSSLSRINSSLGAPAVSSEPTSDYRKLSSSRLGTISGRVTDLATKEALIGVNVYLDETRQGSATGLNGDYVLDNVEPGCYTLVASFIGYKRYATNVAVVTGEITTANIQLTEDVLQLDAVVVNAMGFEEERDQQGVASSHVDGQAVTRSGEATVLKGLSAKVPGVKITSSSGDPGSGARILIRGARTLGGNQPLIVVDGTPISNASQGSGNGGVIQQSRLNDVNPDDVESIEVLKGPSAAALWGTRAANGVLVITTRKGRRSGGLEVSFKSSASIDELNRSVPLQQAFGQGTSGNWSWNNSRSWGDRIADRTCEPDAYSETPGSTGRILQKNSCNVFDHSREVFQTGVALDNSLSVSGGDANSRFYVNVAHLTQDGIIEKNSDYRRTSLRFNADRRFSNWFKASVNSAVVRVTSNRVQQGVNRTGLMLGMLRTPPDFNNKPFLVDYIDANGNAINGLHRSYRNGDAGERYISALVTSSDGFVENPGFDNPFWTIRFNENNSTVNRAYGNTELELTPYTSARAWMTLVHRMGFDFYEDDRYELNHQGNSVEPAGTLAEDLRSRYTVNSDLIARGGYQLSPALSLSGLAGWNLNHREGSDRFIDADGMIFRNVPRDVENFRQVATEQNDFTIRTAAFYSQLEIAALDQLFLDFTGRWESASTFGTLAKSSFFYPSASVAWQFSEWLTAAPGLSFGKLRASYGVAGIQPPAYVTNTAYVTLGVRDFGFGSNIESRQYGGAFARSNRFGNPFLVPERVRELELGTDLRFFEDRLSVGVTQYFTRSTDVILAVAVNPSSGYATRVENTISLENTGQELYADALPVQKGNFTWKTFATWSRNENEVTDLAGVESIELDGLSVDSRAAEGQPFGVLWGGRWQRNEDGSLYIYDGSDPDRGSTGVGFPVEAPTAGPIGDPNPEWELGLGNTLRYKSLALNVLWDISVGGKVWNGTRAVLYSYGTHADMGVETVVPIDQVDDILNYNGIPVSLIGRPVASEDGSITGYRIRGHLHDWDGDGPAPTVAMDERFYRSGPGNHFNGPAEQFVEDGGYIRLREVSLAYALRSRYLRAIGASSLDLGFTARNLLLFTDYTGIDPETSLTGTGNGRGLDYFNNPNTRSYTFSLKFNY